MILARKLITFSIWLITVTATANVHGETYLCVADYSVGFQYKKGAWGQSGFDVSEEKFLIRKLEKDKYYGPDFRNFQYAVFPIGTEDPTHSCAKRQFRISEEVSHDYICGQGFETDILGKIIGFKYGHIYFSPKSGRYLETYMGGYWSEEHFGKDSPYITKGRCSKI